MDTLSWARLGARATGVDFSPRAIALARELARKSALPASFHCLEVTTLPPEWDGRFDIVFTSYGVLPWLPALGSWARAIARVLRPGGSFHLVEFHPITGVLDEDGCTLRQCFDYLDEVRPGRWQVRDAAVELPLVFSMHGGSLHSSRSQGR